MLVGTARFEVEEDALAMLTYIPHEGGGASAVSLLLVLLLVLLLLLLLLRLQL